MFYICFSNHTQTIKFYSGLISEFFSEFESSSSLVGENQNTYPTNADSVEGRATSPPEIILGVLNYGNVWTQGIDIAFTQIFSQKLALTGNFSWYNTTEFYNELTRQNDLALIFELTPAYLWIQAETIQLYDLCI